MAPVVWAELLQPEVALAEPPKEERPAKAPPAMEPSALPQAPDPEGKAPTLAATAPMAERRTRAMVAGLPACTFDSRFQSYARRWQDSLHNVLSTSHPTAQQAEMEVENGLATKDCRQVNAAIAKLEKVAGVQL